MTNETLFVFKSEVPLSRSAMVSEIARELELRDDEEIPTAVHDALAGAPLHRWTDAVLGEVYQQLWPEDRVLVCKPEGWCQVETLELNEGHYFEALDRSHVLMCTYADFVESHPAVQAHPEIRTRAEAALEAMMNVYQAIGAKMPWED